MGVAFLKFSRKALWKVLKRLEQESVLSLYATVYRAAVEAPIVMIGSEYRIYIRFKRIKSAIQPRKRIMGESKLKNFILYPQRIGL